MSEYLDLVKRGGNQALRINGPAKADFHITVRGSDWLFTVFCIFTFFCIIAILLMFRKPANERFIYYTVIIPYAVMAVNYFTMASNLGWAPVEALYNRHRVSTQTTHLGTRQVYYSRFIGWFLSAPWPIIQLSLMGKTPLWHIIFNCFFCDLWVIGFLVSCVVHSTYKWGYYSFGVGAMIVTLISLITTTKNLTVRIGPDVTKAFTLLYGLNAFIWLIYPICFGLSEGGNVIVPDSEHIWYGILDLIWLCFLPACYLAVTQYIGLDKMGLDTLGAPSDLEALPNAASTTSVASKTSAGTGESAEEKKKKIASPLNKLKKSKKTESK